jgi:hypothetical protein
MAENCSVLCTGTVGLFGERTMDNRLGGLTVRVTFPVTPLNVALTELVPAASPVARPAGETVAMVVALEAHVAVCETSF